ncbi:ribonuclease Y [Secundilactobacillus paracollinoides]|uniref:ribonuclease Y n=1 Tax=Secundilactobacillus paracollinoides TaxID=240427 RepID=UPI000A8A40D6|nr:ribonuclease Y [Secundilactobacillus paracollinoides]
MILTGFIILMLVMLVIGLIIGGASRRHQYRAEIANAKQQAEALRDKARADAKQQASAYLAKAKTTIQTERDNSEAEITDQQTDVTNRVNRVEQRKTSLDQMAERLDQRQSAIDDTNNEVKAERNLLAQKRHEASELSHKRQEAIAERAELQPEAAQQMIRDETTQQLANEKDATVRELTDNAEASADKAARNLIIESIQRGPVDLPREHAEHTVLVPTNDTKTKLVGRDGQHIRLLESLTGTDLVFDTEQPNVLIISTHDPVRRETARIAIESLLASRKITAANIEKQVLTAENDVLKDLRQTGEKAVSSLKIGFMHPDFMKLIGRLKFRTSYGQNMLSHSIEVAQMCGVMASELGENVRLAKRAGLLHDIGKSIDHEIEGTHVEIGAALAKAYGEDPVVINAIAAHHGDVEGTSPIATLVATADSVSGSRPGARSESVEEYINRLHSLEKIANDHTGVQDSYAIQAGCEIRIVVQPKVLDDDASAKLTNDVKDQIERDLTYPGKIKVTTIRELRAVEYVGDKPTKKKSKKKKRA